MPHDPNCELCNGAGWYKGTGPVTFDCDCNRPLKPSPCNFCGHDKCKVTGKRKGGYVRTGTNYQVLCNKCFARGPTAPDQKQAITRWNAVI